MIYKDGIWIRENICDLTPDEQFKIRTEVAEAYAFFGYKGQKLDNAVDTIMHGELVDATNLIGLYHFYNRERQA